MKRILVPTDFSTTAEKAFRFAADIASKSGGTVILYHAYTSPELIFAGTKKTREQHKLDAEADLLKQLQHQKNKVVADYPHLPIATIVEEGHVVDKILAFSENEHVDLIVMGTQGATGLKKNIIGSVAGRVIEKSNLPVLLIPEKYEWSEPSKIIFAINYQASDKDAIPPLLKLSKLYNATVTVVHLYDFHEMEEEKARNNFAQYGNVLEKAAGSSQLEFRFLKVSSIMEAMETLDQIVPYDILVMVSRRRTFLEKILLNSFIQDMAYLNRLPLLVLQETGKPGTL